MIVANKYRSHTCGALRAEHVGSNVRLAGWVDGIRDHGGVIFLDLRDQFGLVQVVLHDEKLLEGVSKEAVISVYGTVVARVGTNVNPKLATGEIELHAQELELLGRSVGTLPFEIENSTETREDLRLRYRFLDLRNKKVRDCINLRANVVAEIRNQMASLGFLEVTTPILTASSPEGARDYLIPSRKHPGQFYALPQAPQIFKQLLMVSGVDRYFQIAPCFRDEDARADRSPGEFYQLDFEMAFATQEDVLSTAEQVMYAVFTKYSDGIVSPAPFPRIPYTEAMLRYGSDKPDLRNPLEITELSDLFTASEFKPFSGKTVRGIAVPGAAAQPRSFYDQMLEYASSIGMQGLGYVKVGGDLAFQGPIDKFLSDAQRAEIVSRCGLAADYALFFIADSAELAPKLAGQIRTELAKRLDLIEKNSYRFCYVVDFPMYELDEETGAYAFVHNPFSMPQGGLEAITNQDPLTLLAHQYDIVCNGVELSSGAVRNHDVEIMKKAFEIAGYPFEVLEKKFGSLYTAFQYGAPPHAGMAPGIDRIVMLLAGTDNIRDIIAFPMTANAQDLLMGAPGEVTAQQLREVHIAIREPEKV